MNILFDLCCIVSQNHLKYLCVGNSSTPVLPKRHPQKQTKLTICIYRVVIPLCGGNIDTTILGRCLERGLAAEGRLITFSVTVSDR